jgi:hypothetical protein
MSTPPQAPLDAIEATLADLVPRLTPAQSGRGRPEILPAALLWTGVLVGILRATTSQQAIWRLLSQAGLWHVPRIPISAEAVRIRLQRRGPTQMEGLFTAVTATLMAETTGDMTVAPGFSGVYAIDDSTLDGIARTLPTLRDVPAGESRLLPGKLSVAFDLRRQLFHTVLTSDLPRQSEKVNARALVETLPVGSLILADLGYFSFPWFDDLSDAGYSFISKLRAKTTTIVAHVLTETPVVTDALVWLGANRQDQAKHLVRLVTIRHGQQEHRFITNVLDPHQLSVAAIDHLYSRRWDVELAFKLIKRELGLHLLWSARWEMILIQVWGVLIIAQIAAALRQQIAERAGVDLFDVSLSLLLRDLPYLARNGHQDLIGQMAALPPVKGGYLRPHRRQRHTIPPDLSITPPPDDLQTTRPYRYAGRKCGPQRTNRPVRSPRHALTEN